VSSSTWRTHVFLGRPRCRFHIGLTSTRRPDRASMYWQGRYPEDDEHVRTTPVDVSELMFILMLSSCVRSTTSTSALEMKSHHRIPRMRRGQDMWKASIFCTFYFMFRHHIVGLTLQEHCRDAFCTDTQPRWPPEQKLT